MTNLPIPVPRTWNTNDVASGALLNTNVRDGLNYLINPPVVNVYQIGTQSVASGAFMAVSFDTTVYDSYGGHSNVTNNTRYTAQVAGFYIAGGVIGFATNGTGVRSALLSLNGSGRQGTQVEIDASAGATTVVPTGLGIVQMAVGDYIEIQCYQNSGGALSTSTGSASLTAFWVHA